MYIDVVFFFLCRFRFFISQSHSRLRHSSLILFTVAFTSTKKTQDQSPLAVAAVGTSPPTTPFAVRWRSFFPFVRRASLSDWVFIVGSVFVDNMTWFKVDDLEFGFEFGFRFIFFRLQLSAPFNSSSSSSTSIKASQTFSL
ncbi:hypothetical protein L484_012635 [Morus notabilis]|uniref:Uncharacterized protein n=1 Tax=Morus notabilis TaxID=981085 RepID=W9S9N3_9ROSA|nr:hypothetical protein L484_012635 [Morus notabilis]